jgi:hypothetical protein
MIQILLSDLAVEQLGDMSEKTAVSCLKPCKDYERFLNLLQSLPWKVMNCIVNWLFSRIGLFTAIWKMKGRFGFIALCIRAEVYRGQNS